MAAMSTSASPPSPAERLDRWLRELHEVDDDVGMLEQFAGCFSKLHELLGPRGSYYVRAWATLVSGHGIVIGLRRHLVMPKKAHDVTLLGTLTRMVDGGTRVCKSSQTELPT